MSYQFHNLKVLIVEDNKPMLELTKSILASFGVGKIEGCLNGADGFNKFCSFNPDLVIIDWMMEPYNGVTLSRKIRNDPKSPNQYVPIVLMTGFSEKRRVLCARDAGITEFLVKPFSARLLYQRLVQIIERPRQFVRTESFFGPDRRRKADEEYKGPKRRKSDQRSNNPARVEMIDFIDRKK